MPFAATQSYTEQRPPGSPLPVTPARQPAAVAPQAADFLVGDVATYRLGTLIGEGGMGTVLRAECVADRTHVAVKLVRPELLAKPEFGERLRREVALLRRFSHPSVVNLIDAGDDPDRGPFAVFEFLTGTSLGDVLEAHGPLAIDTSLAIMAQVLDAIEAAHSVGVLHRDLKPDNIFVLGDDSMSPAIRVKVLDFGIGRLVAEHEARSSNPRLTRTGTVVGTPSYMAPEQAIGGRDQDHRVDVFSAGVVLYQLLSNALPHDGENYNQIIAHVMDGTVVPLTQRVPGLDASLAAIVHCALDRAPDARFPSAAAFRDALRAWQRGDHARATCATLPAPPPISPRLWRSIEGLPSPRRSSASGTRPVRSAGSLGAWAGAVTFAAIVLVAGAVHWISRPTQRRPVAVTLAVARFVPLATQPIDSPPERLASESRAGKIEPARTAIPLSVEPPPARIRPAGRAPLGASRRPGLLANPYRRR